MEPFAVAARLKKTLWPLLMDVVNCHKATEPLEGDSLLFTTQSPGASGTQLIEPSSSFEPGTPGMGVLSPKKEVIAP